MGRHFCTRKVHQLNVRPFQVFHPFFNDLVYCRDFYLFRIRKYTYKKRYLYIRQFCKYSSMFLGNTDERGRVSLVHGIHLIQTNRVFSIRLIFLPLFFILRDLLGEEPLTNYSACQQQRPIRLDVLLYFLATCFLYLFNTKLTLKKKNFFERKLLVNNFKTTNFVLYTLYRYLKLKCLSFNLKLI